MNYNSDTLHNLFAAPFDPARWTGVLADLFAVRNDPDAQLFVRPKALPANASGDKGSHLGSFTTSDGYLVGLFCYEISSGSVLRRKVGLRALVKPFLGYDYDAALVVFADRDAPAWRFSFICDIKGEATAPKRFTYVFGDPATPHRTPVERFLALQASREPQKPVSFASMREAFSVEALSDQFFREYKEHYEDFVSYVTGKRFVKQGGKWVETETGHQHRTLYATFGRDDKRVRDYVKKMLGRLVFLHFLQKKGWLGAGAGSWADGDRAFLLHLFEKSSPEQKDDFLDGVLERLFFNALNTDRTAQGDFFTTGVRGIGKCRIPYLNGGLFERDELDALSVKFPAEYFDRLLRFFAEYNFTIDENDPDEAEVGIDPEMLGRIFENLLEDNKDKGAFYTPKEIVGYMCRQSLLAYLSESRSEKENTAIEAFIDSRNPSSLPPALAISLAEKLREVKICDPAIGSGAFPMGLLRELYALRSALAAHGKTGESPADLKRSIIENNIYGVDIEKGAVDIARLRFWLSLVVDEEEPSPLPNLDFKIMQGNSLVESWRGHDLSHLVDQKRKGQLILFETLSDVHRKKLRDLLHKWYSCSDHRERARLRANIRAAAEEQISSVFPDFSFGDLDPSANPEFFLWHLWFAEVFDKGGFDVVIGNPPYVSNMDEETKQYLRKNYEASSYLLDLYIAFIEKSQKLLSKGGMLCFITPNSWMKNLVQAPIRKFVLENLCIKKIVPKITNAFDSANVETSILLARNENRIGDFEVISYQGDTFPFSHTSSTKQFLQNEGLVFDVFTDEITRCILAKMRKGAKPVEALFNIIRGIGPYKVGSAGQTEEIVKSRAYHATYAKDETFVPQLRGKHVKTFSYQWDGKDYISYGKWLSEPRDPSVFEGYRLIFREILGERLVCTFISETFKMDRSLYIAKPKDGSSETCKYVLGVLASKAMIFYFKNSSNEFDELFPKIRVAEFRKLPIPSATAAQQAEIAGLVERVLAAKRGGPRSRAAADAQERVPPVADASALESEIDDLVFDLYGLTPEEREIVKGGGK